MLHIAVADPVELVVIAALIALFVIAYAVRNQVWSASRKGAIMRLGFTPLAPADAAMYAHVQALYTPNGQQSQLINVASRVEGSLTLLTYDVWAANARERACAVALLANELNLPAFAIQTTRGTGSHARRLGEALAAALTPPDGPRELDLPAAPEFSRRFVVVGQDEAEIRRLVPPALTEWLVQIADQPAMDRIAIVARRDLLIWSWRDAGMRKRLSQTEALRTGIERLLTLRRLLDTPS